MNCRERFLATMRFETVDRVPLWEFGYWVGAARRWLAEGMPSASGIPDELANGAILRGEGLWWDEEKPPERDIHRFFQHDPGMRHVMLNNFLCPKFSPEILEDRTETVIARDEWGMLQSRRKDESTLPHFIRGPVRNRDDWEQLRADRLRPTLDGRLPDSWPELVVEYGARDYPLALGGSQGFYGSARRLLGETQVLLATYDQPGLLRDIMTYLADFWCAIYDQVLNQVDVDLALIWEDMCFKTGSLVSPAHFREFMLGPYRKLTTVFRDHGVDVILSDTDGNCWELIPLFLEGGVTGLYPFEVAADMDVAKVREAFPRLQMLGGIDKRALAEGPGAIDMELSRVSSLLTGGGYIPHVDHAVGPDVSWAHFVYYRRQLNEMITGGES